MVIPIVEYLSLVGVEGGVEGKNQEVTLLQVNFYPMSFLPSVAF